MKIFAISDLHLALSVPNKNMDVFGSGWDNYMESLRENWMRLCNEEDIIIVPGDISWAIGLSQARRDFEFINELPGSKILFKGNHDYWWNTTTKLERYKEENRFEKIFFIHNKSHLIQSETQNIGVCGTRGWMMPGDKNFGCDDERIYLREIERFKLSIEDAMRRDAKQIIAAFHYPPFDIKGENEAYINVLKEYNIDQCVFGHIHIGSKTFGTWKDTTEAMTNRHSIDFKLVSADYMKFTPLELENVQKL